jgi:putative endopeptidase
MRCPRIIPILIFSLVTASAPSLLNAQEDSATPKPVPETKSFDASAIDTSADPCTDFYQYACGNWLKSNPIPSDQTRWVRSFSQVQERNRYLLWKDLNAAANDPKTPLQKQYGAFYAACMDTSEIEKKGIEPIKPSWNEVAQLSNPNQLAGLLSELENQGTPYGFFSFGVGVDEKDSTKQIAELYQGGLSLPDREYYINPAEHYATIRNEYVKHVTKMFTLAGDTPEEAAKEAAAVMKIETAMAKASTSRTDLRDPANRYHIYTVADLDKLAPNFDWTAFFWSVGIRHFNSLNVGTPDFIKEFNSLIESEPLASWKSYLRWQILHNQAQDLPKAFFDEDFAFFKHTLAGQAAPPPRWKMCTSLTDDALGEAVGQDWVKQNFPPEAKDSTEKLVKALEKALGDDIKTLPWMSETTKKAAAEKLAMFRRKIGYPEKWRDYSSVKVDRTDFIQNLHHSAVYERDYNYNKLGEPVDEKEWHMTPPTVNAYYSPSFNDINFPAGILQPPFFDFKIDPAVNFGGIGVVIGHEMTHGFDDQGSKFDGKGNLNDWWTAADHKAFDERTSCIADEYSGFEAAPAEGNTPALHLNGHLTLGENTADNGGLRIAYMALENTLAAEGKKMSEKIGGYTEAQRYFLGFAQVWCQNTKNAEARRRVLIDPHSPGKERVNGSVQNFDEFGKAFNCKKGTPMYPTNSCRVW